MFVFSQPLLLMSTNALDLFSRGAGVNMLECARAVEATTTTVKNLLSMMVKDEERK